MKPQNHVSKGVNIVDKQIGKDIINALISNLKLVDEFDLKKANAKIVELVKNHDGVKKMGLHTFSYWGLSDFDLSRRYTMLNGYKLILKFTVMQNNDTPVVLTVTILN